MSQGMSISTQGMRVCQKAMSNNASNIANSQTVGFKGSKTFFQSQFIDEFNSGVKCRQVNKFDSEGSIYNTDRMLDITSLNKKFMLVKSSEGEIGYKNTGSFSLKNNNLVDENNNVLVHKINGEISPIYIEDKYISCTENISISGSLKNNDENVFTTMYVNENGESSNLKFIFNSKGDVVELSVLNDENLLFKDELRVENNYLNQKISLDINGKNVDVSIGGDNNLLKVDSNQEVKVLNDGIVENNSLNIKIDKNGEIFLINSSGEKKVISSISFVSVDDINSLKIGSGNIIIEENVDNINIESGKVATNTLMNSNVELTEELTKLVEMQMFYAHNVQAFKTQMEAEKQLLSLL